MKAYKVRELKYRVELTRRLIWITALTGTLYTLVFLCFQNFRLAFIGSIVTTLLFICLLMIRIKCYTLSKRSNNPHLK